MRLSDVEFVKCVPGGTKVQHNACGHTFCISYCEDNSSIECPECGEIVTFPEGATWA